MKQLVRYTARLAAAVLVLAIMIIPIVAVAAAAGNPFPADLLSRLSGRNVNDTTIIKLVSLCFYVCWAWFCLPALRQLLPTRRRRPQVRARPASRRPAATPTPVPLIARPVVPGPVRGPRAGLARLARFAVSSTAVITSLTGVAGAAGASPARPAAVVTTVVSAASVHSPTSTTATSRPAPAQNAATTVQARHRDTPYAIAARHFPTGQLDTARDEILELNAGRVLPDGTTYRGGGFPAGWDVIVPAGATPVTTTKVDAPPPVDEPTVTGGHVVADGESYWSISEAQLRVELGREPTPQEIFERTQTAIAYNAARLGYDNPKMVHPGDVIFVDAATLSTATSGTAGTSGAPVTPVQPATAVPTMTGGHVVSDGESYWSISEAQLRVELGREATPREALDRADLAIAYNAPLLGYDDPITLHPGDVVFVDAATLSLVAPPAPELPAPADPVVPAVTEPAGEVPAPVPAAPATPTWTPPVIPLVTNPGDLPVPPYSTPETSPVPAVAVTSPVTTSPVPAVASTAPPATSAPRVSADVTSVDHEDMLSSRWLFGGVTVTSLGLVGAWTTVKQMRRRRRRWLGLPAGPDVATSPTERERQAQLDVAMLRQFVDTARVSSNGACAVVLGAHPEIRFRVPAPPAPTGWQLADDRWQRDETEPWTAAPVLSPALVTIGHGTDDTISDVVLDLLSAGTVSVTGDRVAVERLMCSMLWELATAPLGDRIDLHIVGLTSAAARHATNVGRFVSLDEAIAVAQTPSTGTGQVFLVDPFTDDHETGRLRELVEACAPGSGRAVVVAGPCEHPVEEIRVPSEHRAMWEDLTLVPPQLPESVDVELDRMFDAIEVGRRVSAVSSAVTPDPAAEAVALRSTLTVVDNDADDTPTAHDHDADGDGDGDGDGGDGGAAPVVVGDRDDEGPVVDGDLVELPKVVLSVCGREVAVRGHSVPKAAAVLFVLAAAGRDMHSSELTELTGYAAKTLSTVFPASHELVERQAGTLRIADNVRTDHAWATRCVAQLAEAMRADAGSTDTIRWMLAAVDALQALEQGPFAVLPAGRERAASSPWGWVDDFPADVPARRAAETEIAEAALALSELWLAAPGAHRAVRAEQMVDELCRLAATVPYAHVVRQVRPSMWVSGADCLLSAAARVAAQDETLLNRVQQTARALAARGHLEASNELADELGL